VVRLTPNAGADRIDGATDGVLRVRVAVRPVDGLANKALTDVLAAALGLPRGNVSIVRGAKGRAKLIELEGVDAVSVRSRWPGVDV
jgi:uncharacterized protein